MRHLKFTLGILLLILAFSSITPALARASMTLTPVWRPGQQLTTLTSSSDFRYVDVELYATGNTQFWAANITCTFTPTVLEGYTVDNGDSDPGNNVSMVTWGPDWGVQNTDFVAVSTTSGQDFDYDSGTGRLSMRATRLGNIAPMGINGAEYMTLLATLRLRVKDLGSTYLAKAATVKCSPAEFLDRDGRVVVRAGQARTASLTVRTGYSISGQALLQAARYHDGTTVQCTHGATTTLYQTTTDRNGRYSFGGSSQLIRDFGDFNCVFASSITNPKAEFLDAEVDLNLASPNYYLLPVVLKGGNVNVSTGSENDIDILDLTTFTTDWEPRAVASAYDEMDVNGDVRMSEADLAMFAGNYDLPMNQTNVDASHVLYGLATDYEGTFPHSHTLWGDPNAGSTQLYESPGRERDFWPAMSPDGSTVAYSRLASRGNQYMLYLSPTSRPRGQKITPRTFSDQALAPSWSPDGQRIAFVCSWLAQTSGYEFNQGNICVIDAGGSNLQQIPASSSKIYPPAWLDNNVLIYGGLASHANANCQDNLCFYDLATKNSGAVSDSLVSGSDVADMPGIGSYFDSGNQTQYLFYRFDDSSAASVRARTIAYDGTSFTLGSELSIATPSSGNDIDYYDVSPFMDVMYYESNVTSSVFRTIDTFYNRDFVKNGSVDVSDWHSSDPHTVDGFVGNIVSASSLGGSGASGTWNGTLAIPTLFHAQRATLDWIP